MRKYIVVAVVVVSGLSGALAFAAGEKRSEPVTIDTVARRASGSAGSTRNSSPATSYIGCQVMGTSSGSPSFHCAARVGGASPVYAACANSVPAMVQAAASVQTDSKINFAWDASGACTSLTVTNYSFNEPKAP